MTGQQHWSDVLATLPDGHPVWMMLTDILREDELAAVDCLCRADLTDSVRHYQAGYLAHARDFAENLREWRAAGMQTD